MLGKFLLTAVVILLAFTLIRQKGLKKGLEDGLLSDNANVRANARLGSADSEKKSAESSLNKDVRLGAYLFLILMTGLGGALYYTGWQDDHTIITVNLHRDGQQQPVSYEVYKFQLGERSFTTTEGIVVTVAASERMEILGLRN